MGARSLSQFRGGNQGLKRILMLGGYYGRTVERHAGSTGFAATADPVLWQRNNSVDHP